MSPVVARIASTASSVLGGLLGFGLTAALTSATGTFIGVVAANAIFATGSLR